MTASTTTSTDKRRFSRTVDDKQLAYIFVIFNGASQESKYKNLSRYPPSGEDEVVIQKIISPRNIYTPKTRTQLGQYYSSNCH